METIINEFSIIKCITGLEYLASLLLCTGIFVHIKNNVPPEQVFRDRVFFTGITVTLIIITASRLLHLNGIITDTFRIMAMNQGWYNDRHSLQMMIAGGICVTGILLIIILDRIIKDTLSRYKFTICGIILLIAYLLIKLVSYHPVDYFLDRVFENFKLGNLIELFCVTWITFSLAVTLIRTRSKNTNVKPVSATRCI